VSGTVNPEGAAVKVHFDFGTTTAYGQSTPAQTVAVGNAPAAFSAALSGLPAGTTVHYRAVASSDFGTFAGADQTLTTGTVSPPPPGHGAVAVGHAKVNGNTVAVRVTCANAPCTLTLKLTAQGRRHHRVGVGSTSLTIQAGQTRIVRISLNGTGKHLLAIRHALSAKLSVSQAPNATVAVQTVTFHAHKHH
jgi:hypothetical protein